MGDYTIRLADDKDKDRILSWRNHDDVRGVMLSSHCITKGEHDSWWGSTMEREDRRILIVLKNNIPLGVITIYGYKGEKKSAWWGFYIDNKSVPSSSDRLEVWLALEDLVIVYARDVLKVSELFCESMKSNEVILAMHKRFGFSECAPPDDSTYTTKSVTYMKMGFPENLTEQGRRIFFLSSYNADFLVNTFKNALGQYNVLNLIVSDIAFGQYKYALYDDEHTINIHDNDLLVFCERIEDLIGDFYSIVALESYSNIELVVEDYMQLIAKATSIHPEREIYVLDFSYHKPFSFSLEESSITSKLHKKIDEINKKLHDFCRELGVIIIPYKHILSQYGALTAYSDKYWYMARSPFSVGFMETLSNTIIGTILASKSLAARVMVLDLDNTLWKGIIGDDGIDGIHVGGDYPGNIYRDLQSFFKSLSQRGVLLCICSKNTEAVALEAIEKHPGMILKDSDFVAMRINWGEKSENIRSLAEELNLGLSSFCFIDDNPVERQGVRDSIPSIFVPELPEDPASWYQFISTLPELTLNDVGAADKKRVSLYKQRTAFVNEEKKFTDKRAFLRSLAIEIQIQELNDGNLYRVHQLFNKTNQFNTSTIRYTRAQLKEFSESASSHVFHVISRDKYTKEFEGVASLVIKERNAHWEIENFVMSCRVMGRSLENAIINFLSIKARLSGFKKMEGRFVATDRNMPVADLYEKLGFVFDKDGGNWIKDIATVNVEDFGITVVNADLIRR
jgi:FkbH-like protein